MTTIYFNENNLDDFLGRLTLITDSERFPGLLCGQLPDDADPVEVLSDGCLDHPFFGLTSGATSVVLQCSGNGRLFAHPSCSSGRILFSPNDAFELQAPPLQVADSTMQFVVALRSLISRMLDDAEKFLSDKLAAAEADAQKRAALLVDAVTEEPPALPDPDYS